MYTWCCCLNITSLKGLHICTLKSNECISTKSTRDPTASLLGRFSSADSLYRQSKHQFLKIHPINQIDNLQNSIKETTNSRETAMALKASTRTHSYFFSHRTQCCHLRSPCQGHTTPSSPCQTSTHGCCWGRDRPLWERAGRGL